MATLASAAMALAMIAVFLLFFGAIRLLRVAETRNKGMLMLTAAAVIFVNVLIWTL